MQTILGSGGPIADMLARELAAKYTTDLRLVSRHPKKVNDTDELFAADLTDAEATSKAVEGSDVVYLTVGLPADHKLWEEKFPVMMRNTIDAVKKHGARLVFFDNTYMYAGTPDPQTEGTRFQPKGAKGRVRAQIASMLIDEMQAGTIEAAICRAPEFYGPGKTKSITNSLVFDRIKAGKRPIVPISAHAKRSLIWTPDASRAMALIGNTDDAFGQTWHLPVDDNRLTYAEIVEIAGGSRPIVLPEFVFKIGARFNPAVAELEELLPRYRGDNIFVVDKFTQRFPDFKVTTYREGIAEIMNG